MLRSILLTAFLLLPCSLLTSAEKYTGPKPPKPDIPYLLHASKLVETEAVEASEQKIKDGSTYTIPGATSPAKTPLAEPIFIMQASKLNPENLELYRLDVKGSNREIVVKRKGGARALHLTVTPLGDRLYRIEASEMLENGEYSLSPTESNQAFCFQVY